MRKQVKQQTKQLSPENYIKTKARTLPIYKCFITSGYQEFGMGNIMVIRKHTTGNITFGTYLVDLYALGVKDTTYSFSNPDNFLDTILSNGNFIEIDYNLAHNIIFGSIEFASEHGFKPHKDFEKLTKYILEIDDDNIPLIDIELVKDGKPFLIVGPCGR